MRFMQTESVLQIKNQSGPAKNRFSVALILTLLGELQIDFCKNLTEFYLISLKHLSYLTDFSLQLMAYMHW